MSDRANKPGSEAENPIASLKPRSKPKERALPFNMDQILAVKDDVASGQWKTPADASGHVPSQVNQESRDAPEVTNGGGSSSGGTIRKRRDRNGPPQPA